MHSCLDVIKSLNPSIPGPYVDIRDVSLAMSISFPGPEATTAINALLAHYPSICALDKQEYVANNRWHSNQVAVSPTSSVEPIFVSNLLA
jgi:hypothetical protein